MADESFLDQDAITLEGSPIFDFDNFDSLYEGICGDQQLVDAHETIGIQKTCPLENSGLPDDNVDKEIPHSSSCYRFSLPANENWPGDYEFTVSLEPQERSKNVTWTYSKLKNKLYIGKDSLCPINFSANAVLPNDVLIRATVVYSLPDHMGEVVRRCATHSTQEFNRGVVEANHLIRCECQRASYEIDPVSSRHSVVVPFENPAAGQKHSTYLYKFTCFGSCSGGPNRRPLTVVFTLEKDNQVHGRRKLDVKICACPARDRKSEESQLNKAVLPVKRKEPVELVKLINGLEFTQAGSSLSKKTKIAPNKDKKFILEVEDKKCFELLLKAKAYYELTKLMKIVPEDDLVTFLKQYEQYDNKQDH